VIRDGLERRVEAPTLGGLAMAPGSTDCGFFTWTVTKG
jgi:hypothetical protein